MITLGFAGRPLTWSFGLNQRRRAQSLSSEEWRGIGAIRDFANYPLRR